MSDPLKKFIASVIKNNQFVCVQAHDAAQAVRWAQQQYISDHGVRPGTITAREVGDLEFALITQQGVRLENGYTH